MQRLRIAAIRVASTGSVNGKDRIACTCSVLMVGQNANSGLKSHELGWWCGVFDGKFGANGEECAVALEVL